MRRALRSVYWSNVLPLLLAIFAFLYLAGQVVRGFSNGSVSIKTQGEK